MVVAIISGVATNGHTLPDAVALSFSVCVAFSHQHNDVVVIAGVAPAVAKVVRTQPIYWYSTAKSVSYTIIPLDGVIAVLCAVVNDFTFNHPVVVPVKSISGNVCTVQVAKVLLLVFIGI